MADPLLAQTSDLVARGVDVSDAARAAAAIGDASALIHHVTRRRWVGETGELAADVPDIVRTICCKVAKRILTGQDDGIASESLGDYSVAWRGTDAYLTRGERADLLSAAGLAGTGGVLATITTTRGDLETPAVTVDFDLDG